MGGYTQYRYNTHSETERAIYGEIDTLIRYEQAKQTSTISDFILKSHLDIMPGGKHQLRLGTSFVPRTFTIGSESQQDDISNKTSSFQSQNYEVVGYIEDMIRWNKSFSTNVGLHWNGYFSEGKVFHSFQPRFSSKYQLSPNTSIQFAYASMQQNIHLLTNSGFSLPSDIWIPATKNAPPSMSNQFDIGLFTTVKDIFEISLEGFYKRQSNLIEFKNTGTDILENVNEWESQIEKNGTATVKGLELMVQKNVGKWQGAVAYTLSKNERNFENINLGENYLFDYHRPHDFNINIFYNLNPKWSMSANWIYQTGRRITLPIGILPNTGTNSGTELIFGSKNNSKFPDYHRLDMGFTYKKKEKGAQWIFNIYNLYNRKNTSYIYFESSAIFDEQQNYLYSTNDLKSASLFSIIPSLSYKRKF